MSDAISDPVAVFFHDDVRCESISERNWQRLNVDRVISSQFNSTGTLCAMYISYNSIEIWDFSSIPVPMTSLGLPKHLIGRIEGQCYAMAWSPCNKQIIGIFGNKSNAAKRRDLSAPLSIETNRNSYICVWDVGSRRVIHKYRLPFVANSINPISSTAEKSSLYVLGSAHGNCLFLLDTESGKIKSACTGSGILPSLEDMAVWVLYDSVNELTAVAMAVAGASTVDESMFAGWCNLHCTASTDSSSAETVSFSSPLCFVHTPVHGCVLYRAVYDTTDTSNAVSLVALTVGGSTTEKQQAFTELSRTALQSSSRIVSIAYDAHVNLLVLAAADSVCVQVFSVLQEAGVEGLRLQAVATHQPSDRHLIDILNAHTTGIHMRSAAAHKYTANGNYKKSFLPAVPFAMNSTFKCTFAGFYFHQKEKRTNSTRYSNSLTPHCEIPLWGQNTVHAEQSSCAASSGTTMEGRDGLIVKPEQQQGGSTVVRTIVADNNSTVRTIPELQCSILYRIQSGSTQSCLVLWDLDDSSLLGSGKNVSCAVKDAIQPIPLPFSEVTQVTLAPYCSSAQSLSDRGKRRRRMRPPGQALVCLDIQGGAWTLRPQYSSDFPGPMYPVGYTLVTQVIEYMEAESELDKVVVDLTQSTSSNGISRLMGDSTAVVNGPVDHSSSNTLNGAASKTSTNRTVGMSYSSTSSGSLASGMSSDHSSMESLLGLELLDKLADSPKKRIKLEHTPVEPCSMSATAGTTTAMEVDTYVTGLDVAQLVSSHDDAHSLQRRAALPFTFADDYLRFPATRTATKAAAATTVESLGTPSQQSHSRYGGDPQLTAAAPSPLFSPSREHNHSDEDYFHDANDSEDDELSTAAGGSSGSSASRSTAAAFSQGCFEEYFPVPARVQTGAFEVKLREHQHAAQELRELLTQPGRVTEKLAQLQEQVALSVIHAEEVKERSRQRNAVKKQQKENERAAAAAAVAEAAILEKQQKIRSDQQLLISKAGVTAEEAEWMHPLSGVQIAWVVQLLSKLQSGVEMDESVKTKLRMILDASKRSVIEQGQVHQQPPHQQGQAHQQPPHQQGQAQQQPPQQQGQAQQPLQQGQAHQQPPHQQGQAHQQPPHQQGQAQQQPPQQQGQAQQQPARQQQTTDPQ